MKNHKKISPDEIKLLDQQGYAAQVGSLARLRVLFQIGLRVAAFMTDKSEVYSQQKDDCCVHDYNRQARFYAYLPPGEEERAWLEKVYSRSH